MSSQRCFTRVREELRESHLLPQEEAQMLTLLELTTVLSSLNQRRLHILEKLHQCRAVIFTLVLDAAFSQQPEAGSCPA